MPYMVIYDGLCNLCATGVQLLEQLDRGRQFCYAPMQDTSTLAQWGIPPEQVELGMILIDLEHPERRWQGSAAIEQIAALLPSGEVWLALYRNFPGLKFLGDLGYEQIRDHRYEWFGCRNTLYLSAYPVCVRGQDLLVDLVDKESCSAPSSNCCTNTLRGNGISSS
ncbi:thiol-disulfide oxidoreductase DCC family protein [Synechococcus sp. R55.8]|jgi:predicted DCC family thiol-disulfide oxidoreductase YuxK|uniref:thiol-disulfide oxidoreductase DCC family protein n=1 Tax=Synechococcus sp. R55.8 TaxID=2964501 RepID=UPI0039C2C1B8